jgi:hypothetical protein
MASTSHPVEDRHPVGVQSKVWHAALSMSTAGGWVARARAPSDGMELYREVGGVRAGGGPWLRD